MVKGAARRGGMPLYKYLGNRLLTFFENRLLGTDLTEFHSGYRIYSTRALAQVPFEENTDDFHFDTEIIIQFHQHNLRIVEKPIPTFYGDEICYVNGMKYAFNILRAVFRYKLHQAGIRTYPNYLTEARPVARSGSHGCHRKIARAIKGRDLKVLDIGCGAGGTAELVRNPGTDITGVDKVDMPNRSPRIGRFVRQDFDAGLDPAALGRFDYIVLTYVLEHIREPDGLLRRCHRALAPGGQLVACVPNIAHWRKRLKLLFGGFSHATRGTFEATQVNFFTRSSVTELLERCGYEVVRVEATPLPLPDLFPEFAGSWPMKFVHFLGNIAATLWKTLFGFQFVVTAVPAGRAEDRK